MSVATTADLLEALRRYRLLDAGQLAEVEGAFRGDPRGLARDLVRRGWLTGYQVNQLFQGRGQGLVLGSYILLDKLGEGGMGAVFKAQHGKLGRTVALKLIRKERLDNDLAIKRFQREIVAAAQVDHPNIVRAFDADEAGGTHFFVMEYVEGTDLANLVKQRGPLPVAEACDYIRQAAVGLQHAFERGLVHRDIKPANLLLTTKGVVKLLDMGLARMHLHVASGEMVSTLTQEGSVMGTPDYIAPEQAMRAHEADIRADLYSLGCTLYFLLAGKVPFAGGSLTEKLLKHQMDPIPDVRRLRPDVPPPVAALVARLMAKRPEERCQTPAELAAALDAALRGKTVAVPATATHSGRPLPEETHNPFADIELPTANVRAVPTAPDQRPPSEPRRRRILTAVASGGVLLAVVVGLVIWLVARKPPDGGNGAGDTRPEGGADRRAGAGDEKRTIALFNGKDFTGWRPHKTNEIKGWLVGTASFDSSKPGIQAQPAGTELINISPGSCLVTTREFGDCVIDVEVLVGRGSNSGIYVMGEYEIQILDSFGKTDQGSTDMGALFGVAAPRVNACKKAGEWQTLLIDFRAPRFQGNRKTGNAKLVRVLLNGQLIHENVDVPRVCPGGLTGVEHPIGPILLQGDYGGGVAFRNFRVTEGAPPTPADATAEFFNGKDLAGWTASGGTWEVKDGTLIGSTGPNALKENRYLFNNRPYRDFELRCKVRLRGGNGNSGLLFRSERIGDVARGPQADIGDQYWGNLWSENVGGKLRTLKEADRDAVSAVVRPTDFNDYFIRCVDKHVTILLNGLTTVDGDFPEIAREGLIAWQLHSGLPMEITIKDIRFTIIP